MTVRDFPCRKVVQWIAENLDFFSLGIPYFYTFKFRNAKLVSQREVWGQLSPIENFLNSF